MEFSPLKWWIFPFSMGFFHRSMEYDWKIWFILIHVNTLRKFVVRFCYGGLVPVYSMIYLNGGFCIVLKIIGRHDGFFYVFSSKPANHVWLLFPPIYDPSCFISHTTNAPEFFSWSRFLWWWFPTLDMILCAYWFCDVLWCVLGLMTCWLVGTYWNTGVSNLALKNWWLCRGHPAFIRSQDWTEHILFPFLSCFFAFLAIWVTWICVKTQGK